MPDSYESQELESNSRNSSTVSSVWRRMFRTDLPSWVLDSQPESRFPPALNSPRIGVLKLEQTIKEDREAVTPAQSILRFLPSGFECVAFFLGVTDRSPWSKSAPWQMLPRNRNAFWENQKALICRAVGPLRGLLLLIGRQAILGSFHQSSPELHDPRGHCYCRCLSRSRPGRRCRHWLRF